MAAAEKTPPLSEPETSADPFAWDPDPIVLVSRRPRVLYFPGALALREPTAADIAAWTADRGSERPATPDTRQDQQLAISAGVTFLGAYTSSWAYHTTTPGHAPSGPPRPDQMLLVMPFHEAHAVIDNLRNGYKDRETARLRPEKVRAFFLRVLGYAAKHSVPHLFTTPDGFDAPELQLLRLSEIFKQNTDNGQQAHAAIINAIPHLRAQRFETITPLGALHDYAIRSKHGRAIMEACRSWAARKKIGG